MPPMNNGIGFASPGLLIYKAVYFLVFSISSIFETTPKPNNRYTHNDQNITDHGKRSIMAGTGKSMTTFIKLSELPEGSRTCELCENHFSSLELNGAPGYAVYPVRLPCSHIFCYDCARMWISHAKCPECNARFADYTTALEVIDEQIRQYTQYQVACFNGRLQAGMICAPPGYPTFAGQQAGPSRWWHEDHTAEKVVSKSKSTSSHMDEEMPGGHYTLSSSRNVSPRSYLAAQTLLSIANPDRDDNATVSDGLSTPRFQTPSIAVTSPEGHAVRLERGIAVNRLRNVDDDDDETSKITKSEQNIKEFRTALGMINNVSGANYSRGDFPNLKLKYERKARS